MDRMHHNPRPTEPAVETVPEVNIPTMAIPAMTITGVRLGVLLGTGGMASVFEGWDEGFNPPRRVAVKLMSPAATTDPVFRIRFDREASLVAAFRHDNIVRVYSCGEVNRVKYLVMEYLGGGTLAQRLERGRLGLREALMHGAALADALAYSHAFGIIHRDLKPANVLFTSEGKLVLTDFGIAKNISACGAGLTRGVIGPPLYMSPEQALGEAVSDRTDVYSLGLILSDMLADAKLPPRGNWQRAAQPRDLASWLPHVPSAVTEILQGCLQYQPAARPSASEVAQQLRAASLPKPKLRKLPAPAGAERIATAVAGLLLVAGLGLYWLQGRSTGANRMLLIRAQPAAAALYVDGRLLSQPRIALPRGTHQLIAVARGYYGEIRNVVLPEQAAAPLNITLRPLELPSARDFERFLDLADAASMTQTDLDSVAESTLRSALTTKLLRQQQKPGQLEILEQDLRALSDVGDARASVAMVLARGVQIGQVATQLDDRLVIAANQGDAVASLFVAFTLRERMRQATGPGSDGQLRTYCNRMRSAAMQGWESVAGRYLQTDGCNRS